MKPHDCQVPVCGGHPRWQVHEGTGLDEVLGLDVAAVDRLWICVGCMDDLLDRLSRTDGGAPTAEPWALGVQ